MSLSLALTVLYLAQFSSACSLLSAVRRPLKNIQHVAKKIETAKGIYKL